MGCLHSTSRRRCRCCDSPSTSSHSPPIRAAGTNDALGHVISGFPLGFAAVPSAGFALHYASLSQRGHYPESPARENQDAILVRTALQSRPDVHLFAVFDGHGQLGDRCSAFARDRVPALLGADPDLLSDPVAAFRNAFLSCNSELHASDIEDTLSGTTAIAVLIIGDTLCAANVGDSRAVAGVWRDGKLVAEDLSKDQTPFRQDEYDRVRRCGARVLSVDQLEGIKDPEVQTWGNEEENDDDPPRLWVPDEMYPGTAFTRSIGDSTAESIGVIAEPEVLTMKISPEHLFFVVASDGVFEFLSSQNVVDMVAKFVDPRDACSAIVASSYKLWLDNEPRTDDISIIIVHIKDLYNSGAGETERPGQTIDRPAQLATDKAGDGKPVPPGSQICHPGSVDLSKLQSNPADISVHQSSAFVAPSPTCSVLRNG